MNELEAENARLRKSLQYLDAHRIPPATKSWILSLRQENERLRDTIAGRDRQLREMWEQIKSLKTERDRARAELVGKEEAIRELKRRLKDG